MNRDPGVRHRIDPRRYEPEFDRARPPPPRYENRMVPDKFPPMRPDHMRPGPDHIRPDMRGPDRGPPPPGPPPGPPPPPAVTEYRTLCISNLNPRAPDHVVSQALYEEFAPYGDFNVKVVHQGDHRIAYVNFKFADDARTAKHSRRPGSLILFDMPVRVDSVIHRRPHDGFNRDHGRGGGNFSPGGRRPYDRDDNNAEGRPPSEHKFPHHLNHIAPEDDKNATRTLFVGNLDNNITDQELRDVFNQYGMVEDVDIKNPSKQGMMGNAYAFVKFINLDMSHRAKVAMSGKLIGKYQCKIGYGKVSATNCLWVGGVGPWVTLEDVEQEFDRFGAIKTIEWKQPNNFCYIVFDNTDAAQVACTEMRGFALGGPNRRLRVDFSDESHLGRDLSIPPVEPARFHPDSRPEPRPEEMDNRKRTASQNSGDRGVDDYNNRPRTSYGSDRGSNAPVPEERRESTPPYKRHRSSPIDNNPATDDTSASGPSVSHVQSIPELAKCLPVVWNGALVLKNSAFAARMHLLSGDVHLVDTLMRDSTSTEMPVLKITQRLRLDPPKLEEVGRRVASAGPNGQAVLLAMPGSPQALEEAGSSVQQRPLRNLVSYLRQKEAAGVISLPPIPNKDKSENIGVLHSFPPCRFGNNFLTKRAAKIQLDDDSNAEHLVIVVVKGAAL